MDIGLYGYKRASRGIKHKAAAVPFYPRSPAAAAPIAPAAQAAGKAKSAAAPWPAAPAAPLPSSAVAVEVIGICNGGAAPTTGGDDVDRRAALYISRVQERLRRERMNEDWRKYY